MKNSNKEHILFNYSNHSISRAAQRGIQTPSIETIIQEGKTIHKQGYKFLFMTVKELRYHAPAEQKKLKNLVVVMAGDSNTVVTCYKNKDAIGNIKRKSKRLLKNN